MQIQLRDRATNVVAAVFPDVPIGHHFVQQCPRSKQLLVALKGSLKVAIYWKQI
jgi:hypothetical protein